MTALTQTTAAAPTISADLTHALQRHVAATPEDWDSPYRRPRPPTAMQITEARRVLPAVEQHLRPATLAEWRTWLAPAATLPNAPDAQQQTAALSAIAMACSEVPARALTADLLAKALRMWTFWPSPAQVYALAFEAAQPLIRKLATLRKFANTELPTDAPPPAQKISEEERNAVAARMRELIAELKTEQAAKHEAERKASRIEVEAKPLHPDHIRAIRDANPLVQAARKIRAELDRG